jgi:hypothetical protein
LAEETSGQGGRDEGRPWVNGKLVNEGSRVQLPRGRILFQPERAEWFYRNIKIALEPDSLAFSGKEREKR